MSVSTTRVASRFAIRTAEAESLADLVELLGVLHALYLSHWTAHWQVQGDPFYGDHLLLGRLYEAVPKEIDALAEKVVARSGRDAVSVGQNLSTAQVWVNRWAVEPDPIARALAAEQDLQRVIGQAYEGIKATGRMTLGLDDFLMSMANDHETHTYLLQQRLLSGTRGCVTASSRQAAALRTVFLVTDPTEHSEFIDVAAEVTVEQLGNIAIGTGSAGWRKGHPSLHTDEASARADALARLDKRWGGRDRVPAWVFADGTKIQRVAGLDGGGGPDMSAEAVFFNTPRKREVREFAESGAVTNDLGVAKGAIKADELAESSRDVQRQVAESPLTVDEIRELPGSGEFSTLNRYVVQTEQPTDAGVPQGREDAPRHPNIAASVAARWKARASR